jgi:hypothetical protein
MNRRHPSDRENVEKLVSALVHDRRREPALPVPHFRWRITNGLPIG